MAAVGTLTSVSADGVYSRGYNQFNNRDLNPRDPVTGAPSTTSLANIFVLATNEAGNVVGLMPHPEHAVEDLCGPGTDGLGFFTSAVAALQHT